MSAFRGSAQLPPPAARIHGWGLLDSTTHIEDLRNETTAGTLTRGNITIHVSFVFADLPRLSYFCVYCPTRPPKSKTPFASAPTVVSSVEDTALIRVVLTTEESPQYFLYRARGPYGGPSLNLLPDIYEYSRIEILMEPPLAFVSHDNKQFVMAALSYIHLRAVDDGKHYYLHTISSEPGATWSKKLLEVEVPDCFTTKSAPIFPTKVIALGHGLVGWVDLLKGIVICNVLNSAAVTKGYFVPMPNLLPRNNELYCSDPYSARRIRDVTFSGGYIKCVEFEELVQVRARPAPAVRDPWNMPELHDSQLAISPPQEEEEVYDVVGWRLITWYRGPGWTSWRRGNTVHSDDLGTVSLPQLGGGPLPLKKLKTASPTLRGDDDVVYLMSMLHGDDQAAWIVTVDTKRKSLGEIMLSPADESSIYDPTIIPCVLSKYLDGKSGGAQPGKRNASHFPASRNLNESKKQRQAELEEHQRGAQLLLHSSAATMIPVSSAQYV
ncbi:unnamed protein product [Alopecurus aequalis]